MRVTRKYAALWLFIGIILCSACTTGCEALEQYWEEEQETAPGESFSMESIPEYSGEPYVVIGGNEPDFSAEELTEESFESYSELDGLGRCQEAYANLGQDLMPKEERGSIGKVKPTGWHTVKYDNVDGKYL